MRQVLQFVRGIVAVGVPALALSLAGCATSGGTMMADKGTMKETTAMMAMDPMKAQRASIDRFSASASRLRQAAVCHRRTRSPWRGCDVLQL
jgi:Flp pilus assembly protein TadD